MMKVRVEKMILEADKHGVSTLANLVDFLNATGVKISERTLYNWQQGGGFQSKKLDACAATLGYENPMDLIEVS